MAPAGKSTDPTISPVRLSRATSRGPPPVPPAVNALTSRVRVTTGPPRPSPPSGGRSRSRKSGWLRSRSPSPFGTIQAWSPVLRSIAVIREYGGLSSGSPRGICGCCGPPSLPTTYRVLPWSGSGVMYDITEKPFTDGTYNTPVSGSKPAPVQFAPPSMRGR